MQLHEYNRAHLHSCIYEWVRVKVTKQCLSTKSVDASSNKKPRRNMFLQLEFHRQRSKFTSSWVIALEGVSTLQAWLKSTASSFSLSPKRISQASCLNWKLFYIEMKHNEYPGWKLNHRFSFDVLFFLVENLLLSSSFMHFNVFGVLQCHCYLCHLYV